MKRFLAIAALALARLAFGQELKLEVFDRLKDRATESTNLNLSKELLSLATSFLGSDKGADSAKLKKLTEGLAGILVRTLEFDKEGVYTDADVQQLIRELGTPGWSIVISADGRHGNGHEISRIWVKSANQGEVGGLRILSAEDTELSVIEISGRIRLQDLK